MPHNDTNSLSYSCALATAAINCSPPRQHLHNTTAIINTGASNHYFTPDAPLSCIDSTAPSTNIRTATGETKTSTAFACFALPTHIPTAACTGHIIPGFTNNLTSLGKLCDNGCTGASLDKQNLWVRDNSGRVILHGKRKSSGARLWQVNIGQAATPQPRPTLCPAAQLVRSITPTLAARAHNLPSTPALIAFLHAMAGYPVKQTWLVAIKRGAYVSWPGLSYTLAARYCPTADETLKGHTAQPRQHIRSTQQTWPTAPAATSAPLPGLTHDKSNTNSGTDLAIIPANTLFTDDTGRFTPRARSGNQYIMIAIHRLSNAILVRPFVSKHDSHCIAAYQDIYTQLAQRDAAPTLHILDNEISATFQHAITTNRCSFQLVPPHVHRRNAAERAIRTFKDHFLAILAGISPTFPKDRWDLLLPQAELTLNLLRPSPSPTQSAWEYLSTQYNFDATPMGPASCRILIHNKATVRRSWDFQCSDGYYIGPTLNHYCCYRAINKALDAAVVMDAIKFRHHYLPAPTLTLEDKLLHALQAIHGTLSRTSQQPASDQLAAINALRLILSDYKDVVAPPGVGPPPGVSPLITNAATLPGVPHTVQHTSPIAVHPNDNWTIVQPR